MNGSTNFESEQIGEFQFGTFFAQVAMLPQFLLEVELAVRTAIAAADPSNSAKQTAKLIAAERESADRRTAEAESESRRLQEAQELADQQSSNSSKSSLCIIF
jgi:hypothetical protein